jgi:hypothetical protein
MDADDRDKPDEPGAGAAAMVAAYGAHARPLRELIAALTEGPRPLAALVRETATPRRTVEELLAALGDDLVETAGGYAVAPDLREGYRRRFGYDQLRRTALADPLAGRLAAAGDLRAELARLVAAAPASRQALDHVAATPGTAARRALWLDARYDLAGARLLCVGDHDLTSLAACLVNRDLATTVVDVDERILEFIDAEAARLGLDVRCLFADLRLGLPTTAAASADLVFTDPPYTPEGVRLFLARGAQGLRDRERGRLVMAYGFSDRTPALGLKVQQAAQDLALAYEAILPAMNRYDGAQAVGSAADLYVCRPTARTWKLLDRAATGAANIYTHGPQSLEGGPARLDPATAAEVLAAAGPVTALVGDWPAGTAPGVARTGLDTVLAGGLPPAATAHGHASAAVDLAGDHGPLLLRALLAANADRLVLLVPNGHPDLASEAGQRALAALVGAKYRLRFRRSTPGPAHAVVEAVATGTSDPGAALVRRLLDRAHGRIANVWREGLIAAGRRTGAPPTKNEARAAVRAACTRPDLLDAALIDLPRHQVRQVLAEVAASAAAPEGGAVL